MTPFSLSYIELKSRQELNVVLKRSVHFELCNVVCVVYNLFFFNRFDHLLRCWTMKMKFPNQGVHSL